MMNPNANMLALRDPARAAMVGAIPGADFGHDFGGYQQFNQGGFGADLVPNAANMQLALSEANAQLANAGSTQEREAILNPNADSTAKIQRYVFALSEDHTLGTAAPIAMTGKPRTQFRPQRITTNVPFPGLAYFTAMQVANIGILVGGKVDAWDFCARAHDQHMDTPTLGPQNEVSVAGSFTTRFAAAAPFATGADFILYVSFKGPATMAGG